MKTCMDKSEPLKRLLEGNLPLRRGEVMGRGVRDVGGWAFLCVGLLVVGTIIDPHRALAQGGGDLKVESFVRRGTDVEIRMGFSTLWGRRYRIETSTNLIQWETKVVTEPAQGPIGTVVVQGLASMPRFYRSSLFDWEELKAELKAARELWRTRGLDTYHFEFRWNFCNCHPDFLEWVRVDVRDKVLVGVTRLSTGEPLPPDRWSHYTVEGMFQWIEDRLSQHPEVMRVRFNPDLGYPTDGYYDLMSMLADEEIGFELAAVRSP